MVNGSIYWHGLVTILIHVVVVVVRRLVVVRLLVEVRLVQRSNEVYHSDDVLIKRNYYKKPSCILSDP